MKKLLLGCGIPLAMMGLCCAGTVSYFLGGLGTPSPSASNATLAACGQGVTNVSVNAGSVGGLTVSQMKNAAAIIASGQETAVPPRGWVIAIATALQESNLNNLGNLGAHNDHDSLGLFQQRPSQEWGTPAQLMDPAYASAAFYARMVQVPNWTTLPLTVVAQSVQRSAFPDAYTKHEPLATQIVDRLANGAARAVGGSVALQCNTTGGQIAASGWTVPVVAPIVSGFRTPARPTHNGDDLAVPKGTPIHAASSGIVLRVKCDVSAGTCDQDGSPAIKGCGWYVDMEHAGGIVSRYCHQLRQPIVHVGQQVSAGQIIGVSGTSGNSSGPHVHFEIHINGDESSAGAIDPTPFMASKGAPLGK